MKHRFIRVCLWLLMFIAFTGLTAENLFSEQVRVKLFPEDRSVTGELKEFVFGSHLTIQKDDSLLTFQIAEMRNIRFLPSEQSYLTTNRHDFDQYQQRTRISRFSFEPTAGINYGKMYTNDIGTSSGMGFSIGGFSATELSEKLIFQTNVLVSSLRFFYQSGNEPIGDRPVSSGTETHISLMIPASIRYRIPVLTTGWELYPGVGMGLSIPFYARQNLKLVGNATENQTVMITDNLQTAALNLNVAMALHTGLVDIDVCYSQGVSDVYVHPQGCKYQSVELLLRINRLRNLLSTAL